MYAAGMSSGVGKIKKVGVLGGTFDPVHNGHLAIAEEAREYIGMLEVLFVPAGRPWMKSNVTIAPAKQRLDMVKLAIEDKPYFKLSTIEVDNPGPSYTVDAIDKIREEFGGRAILYFIMSWETLADLPRWKEPERLIELCYLVVAPRPGVPRPDMNALQDKIPGLGDRVIFLDKPEVSVSATDIRNRLSKGQSISEFVPEKVASYIKENDLYRK